MTRFFTTTALCLALTACGDGSPFGSTTGGTTDDGDVTSSGIPADIASSVTGFTYNPSSQTLSLTGTLLDGDETTVDFRRRSGLDKGPYQAYTAQDDALDEHTTVYVRELGEVRAAVAVTGGQFSYYEGGVSYGRDGGYSPVQQTGGTGLVTYAGDYIGLSNLNGPDTDLAAVPGTISDDEILPSQASTITGKVFINVGFGDESLKGLVYNRNIDTLLYGTVALPDLELQPTELLSDGTFTGNVTINGATNDVGQYAGILGGPNSSEMAGGLFVKENFGDTSFVNQTTGISRTISGEEEYGMFVLGQCGGPNEDASAECTAVD